MKQRGDRIKNNDGAVLVTSLLIMALITIMITGAVMVTNTEVQISGNLKTASLSLYVAEGGLEVGRSVLQTAGVNQFAANGATNSTVSGFQYSSACATCTSITYPLNWVDNTWQEYDTVAGTCTGAVIGVASTWPVCKPITVGVETALVIIPKPVWSQSSPTKVVFNDVTSRHTSSAPNKAVAGSFELDYGNNMLVFQVFRAADTVSQVDNLTSPTTTFLSPINGEDFALGGGGTVANTDRITGIYSGNNNIQIDYCTTTVADCDTNGTWINLGIAEKNSANKTFMLLSGSAIDGPAAVGTQCLFRTIAPLCASDPAIYTPFDLGLDYDGYFFRAVEINSALTCTLACTP